MATTGTCALHQIGGRDDDTSQAEAPGCRLFEVTFRSSAAHQPVIEALELIRRFAGAGNTTYYPLGEVVPLHRGRRGDWEDVVHRPDTRGRRRVVRVVYAVAPFQVLRDALRCKGSGLSAPTAGATPTKTSRPTTPLAASSTTARCASPSTHLNSSTRCVSRCTASYAR